MDKFAIASQRGLIAAFVALAILMGPVASVLSNPFYFGLPWPTPLSSALAQTAAGVVLLGLCLLRGTALPRQREWLALAALLMPQLAMGFIAGLHLSHDAPWGAITIVRFASPLWLALLSALQLIRQEVPRATAGAAIAGVGSFLLATPVSDYRPAMHQVPMLVVHLLLAIAMAYTWAFAARRLANAAALSCAAWFLMMQGIAEFVTGPIYSRGYSGGYAPPFESHAQAVALLARGAVAAACAWLWFRLLQRMRLSAFAMFLLAAWTASVLPGAWMGWMQWRFALAPAIGVGAVLIGLRARVEDEQPTALGLNGG